VSKKSSVQYKGVLAVQIELPHLRAERVAPFRIVPRSHLLEVAQHVERERQRKLVPLMQHFGIDRRDPERWRKLALAMATLHVPGFQTKRRAGRPPTESIALLSALYRSFIRELARQRLKRPSITISDADVCGKLRASPAFQKEFPSLKVGSTKRLQNLIVKAKELRRAYLAYVFSPDRKTDMERAGSGAAPAPLPPPWHQLESAFYRKYAKPLASRSLKASRERDSTK
jgi:hypothetical protein